MELNNINVNEVNNMKDAINDYRSKVGEPLSKLSHKVEYAEAFKGSTLAEIIKGYLEAMVSELQKVDNYVSKLDQSLNNNTPSKEETPVEVELTPVTISDVVDA